MSKRRFRVTARAVRVPTSGGPRSRHLQGEVVELDDRDPDQRRAIADLLAMGSAVEEEASKPERSKRTASEQVESVRGDSGEGVTFPRDMDGDE